MYLTYILVLNLNFPTFPKFLLNVNHPTIISALLFTYPSIMCILNYHIFPKNKENHAIVLTGLFIQRRLRKLNSIKFERIIKNISLTKGMPFIALSSKYLDGL